MNRFMSSFKDDLCQRLCINTVHFNIIVRLCNIKEINTNLIAKNDNKVLLSMFRLYFKVSQFMHISHIQINIINNTKMKV